MPRTNGDQRPAARAEGRRRGFTLTELLIVISIILVLTVLSVSAYESVSQKSEIISCGNRLRQVGQILNRYADDYYSQFPTATPPLGFGSLYNWGDLWADYDSAARYFSTREDPANHTYTKSIHTYRNSKYWFIRFSQSKDPLPTLFV